MKKRQDEDQSKPEDLVQAFAACENFPATQAGVIALAQALARASSDFRIPMAEIVQRCSDMSKWCPVPREIRNVALGIRDERRAGKEQARHTQWEQLYGPAEPEWSERLIGIAAGATHQQRLDAIHTRAIRDMLYYTEGDGREFGDRKFWEEHARPLDLRDHAELVSQVRSAGGWQTERELQMDWIDGGTA